MPKESGRSSVQIDVLGRPFSSALEVSSAAPERAPTGTALVAVPANGTYWSSEFDHGAVEYVARLFDVATSDISLVENPWYLGRFPSSAFRRHSRRLSGAVTSWWRATTCRLRQFKERW
jgi:hypothetical protein